MRPTTRVGLPLTPSVANTDMIDLSTGHPILPKVIADTLRIWASMKGLMARPYWVDQTTLRYPLFKKLNEGSGGGIRAPAFETLYRLTDIPAADRKKVFSVQQPINPDTVRDCPPQVLSALRLFQPPNQYGVPGRTCTNCGAEDHSFRTCTKERVLREIPGEYAWRLRTDVPAQHLLMQTGGIQLWLQRTVIYSCGLTLLPTAQPVMLQLDRETVWYHVDQTNFELVHGDVSQYVIRRRAEIETLQQKYRAESCPAELSAFVKHTPDDNDVPWWRKERDNI